MGWITCISDLHGRIPSIRSDSKFVLLGGDICPDGGIDKQLYYLNNSFAMWLERIKIPVIAVPGNHDKVFDINYYPKGDYPKFKNFYLLGVNDDFNTISFDGIKIFGIPFVLDKGPFYKSEEEIEKYINMEYSKYDVLLSHNPPLGILDSPSNAKHIGSVSMAWNLYKRKPKLAVFGHVHEARGWKVFNGVYCVNSTLGSGCDRNGIPVKPVYEPWGLSDNSWR